MPAANSIIPARTSANRRKLKRFAGRKLQFLAIFAFVVALFSIQRVDAARDGHASRWRCEIGWARFAIAESPLPEKDFVLIETAFCAALPSRHKSLVADERASRLIAGHLAVRRRF